MEIKHRNAYHKSLYENGNPIQELIQIYTLYIRSVVEQYATVWHSSITSGEENDLERTQKVALKIIFGNTYTTYADALKWARLDTLSARRSQLCLKFAKKCTKNEKTKSMFPLNETEVNTRNREHYRFTSAKTDRLARLAIPYMQIVLNADHNSK